MAPHRPDHAGATSFTIRAAVVGRFARSLGGNTLVVDVTNFNRKQENYGTTGENLHDVERWTRTGPDTLELIARFEDPTTWTKSWTVKEEFNRQNNEANRIYQDNRCQEGNYGLVGMLTGARRGQGLHRGAWPGSSHKGGGGGE